MKKKNPKQERERKSDVKYIYEYSVMYTRIHKKYIAYIRIRRPSGPYYEYVSPMSQMN